MVQGIDEWERRSAIEGSTVIQSSRDSHRGFINIRNAKIDFPHNEVGPLNGGSEEGCLRWPSVSGNYQDKY
jgi:hypothetical protein